MAIVAWLSVAGYDLFGRFMPSPRYDIIADTKC